ncbi:class 1 fructose-bisphosphatase [Polymorphobacter fuscus]|uniref:Fructose-1,6-bisphosphatase class 1 n=1 Tax=Sandarakinorhabdus fusca TaxID=1439888 RepID=A0A7C9GRV9_9SPHN|nr:class 1 fructose-bisphosphatase [Polymorphobacter fuscus]KAB7643747.1 class 1 fructose-bisphosphatase [Polymorphobacter fuscus]MQT18696.1 class 1 fructose-bisphosphatase [Polymorphobacter fuscus]NJC08087.1 fructose-1,6-bisphosphatase I [Polymorphobacter fuscus]
MTAPTLAGFLAPWAAADARNAAATRAILAIADVCAVMQTRVAGGALVADHGALVGDSLDGDGQKALDQWADNALVEALGAAGVGALVSEERPDVVMLGGSDGVAVAFDPLDGSSNIASNGLIGTIFSVLPDIGGAASFFQPGRAQVAAGYVLFGPQTSLGLTIGNGTQLYVLDPVDHVFRLVDIDVHVPPQTREYAINGSNHRHWGATVRAYVDDCIAGTDGPRGADTNTRWVAAVVADAHRILCRGGVYLYPRDLRPGYEQGRLRLLYEASPIAFLIEQAGGKAFDGRTRILDLVPTAIHQRVPLIFGSADEIDRIARYKSDPNLVVGRAPLFHRRGLFKGA